MRLAPGRRLDFFERKGGVEVGESQRTVGCAKAGSCRVGVGGGRQELCKEEVGHQSEQDLWHSVTRYNSRRVGSRCCRFFVFFIFLRVCWHGGQGGSFLVRRVYVYVAGALSKAAMMLRPSPRACLCFFAAGEGGPRFSYFVFGTPACCFVASSVRYRVVGRSLCIHSIHSPWS